MSLATLVQQSNGQATPVISKPTSTKGLGKLLASSQPATPNAPTVVQPPKSFLQKAGDAINTGAKAVTDFLAPGVTDTLSSDIAHVAADARTKPLLPLPTAGQNLGAALSVGSLVLPATGVERIAGSVAEGALTKAALQSAAGGAQFGVLGGAGQALQKPGATDAEIATEALKQGAIGTVAGGALGLGGALLGKGLSKLLSKSTPLETKVTEDVLNKEITPPAETKIATPQEKQAAYAKTQGYEPITPNEQLPVIQVGKSDSKLPTIQLQPKTPAVRGDLTIEPFKESVTPSQTPQNAPTSVSTSETQKGAVNKPVTRGTGLKDIKTSQSSTAKVSSDINKKLVSQGFNELSDEETSHFNSITKADQVEKVSNLLTNDAEKTQRMATGEEKIPNDVHPQVLFNAVKNKAIQEGDGELLRALASSPIAKQRSLAAQSLGASGFNNGETDAVQAISDINKAREGKAARTTSDIKTAKSDSVKQAKAEIKRTAPTKQTVADFIDSLTC